MAILKKYIKRLFRGLGYEIHKFIPGSSSSSQIISALKKFEIDLILDVGANIGQFGSELRESGYLGEIISFEPLSDAYAELVRFTYADPAWQVHPRCALGDYAGETFINIAGNSASSSILPMLEAHLNAAPKTAYIGREIVPMLTLDEVAMKHVLKFKNPFLKIDTQGFEWSVLDGASNLLPFIRGVLLELSFVPLYDGQYLWQDVIERLNRCGFELWTLLPEFIDPNDGRTLQANGIFFRRDA